MALPTSRPIWPNGWTIAIWLTCVARPAIRKPRARSSAGIRRSRTASCSKRRSAAMRAVVKPMPLEAPVMTTTCSLSDFFEVSICGNDSRDVAGIPVDQIEQAIQPNEAQRAALDDLANASIQAARTIRSACPTHVVLTASGRLLAMQQRIEAMISAVALVRPPLEKFYGLLDDEQKARFNALAEDRRKVSVASNTRGQAAQGSDQAAVQGCSAAPPAALAWPGAEIEA